jgi:hypothetical protein
MPETDAERLADELRTLGRTAVAPSVDADRIAVRVARAVPSGPQRRTSRRRLALVALAVLAALVATPPVRAAVADWLGFFGVRVEPGDPRGAAPEPPALRGGPEVARAAASVPFPVLIPSELGRPRGVEVAPDGRTVSMSWRLDGRVVRLDQFDGTLDFAVAKSSATLRYAAVAGADALWFREPHEVVLLEPDGSRRTETARLAGHTLIWPQGTTTLRLEGDLSLDEAVHIAESVRHVP